MIENVKFKVGDVIRWKNSGGIHWQNSEVLKVDLKNRQYDVKDKEDGYGAFCFHWELELVKPAEPEITEGSFWVHEELKVVVEVLFISTNGRYGLRVKKVPEGYETHSIGQDICFTAKDYTFLECYKPYVEKPKTVKIEEYFLVLQNLISGVVFIDRKSYDSKEKAEDTWDNEYNPGAYRLLDVTKIEWEGESPAI